MSQTLPFHRHALGGSLSFEGLQSETVELLRHMLSCYAGEVLFRWHVKDVKNGGPMQYCLHDAGPHLCAYSM